MSPPWLGCSAALCILLLHVAPSPAVQATSLAVWPLANHGASDFSSRDRAQDRIWPSPFHLHYPRCATGLRSGCVVWAIADPLSDQVWRCSSGAELLHCLLLRVVPISLPRVFGMAPPCTGASAGATWWPFLVMTRRLLLLPGISFSAVSPSGSSPCGWAGWRYLAADIASTRVPWPLWRA